MYDIIDICKIKFDSNKSQIFPREYIFIIMNDSHFRPTVCI